MEITRTVEDSLNGKIFYTEGICPYCKQEVEFMNVGSQKESFICLSCGLKTSFGKEKLVKTQFGYHFEKQSI
jgi:predicted amidophosphoribosyltransferase